ncbi:hypothetical protein BAU15_01885 [Enterococcus sp. JM4C]|uniref:hypothetical protein n=1 Tax=Candidatus Enterococcus huntleyi TaxID=1857217 RepID=UPI00137AC2EB|nr:hypothetical protein [Enterococcus sp. JM4C]KAF1299420.1 hypothetical protein BAU15_01885 [Enterococcus sp. JM4C]
MKRKTLIGILIGAIIVGVVGWYAWSNIWQVGTENHDSQSNSNTNQTDHIFRKEVYLDAKLDSFDQLRDVEATTDELVIATKISQDEPTIAYGAEGRIDSAYTLSTFQVKKVIKGKNLEADDTFTLFENEAYDQNKELTYHIAGYNLIEQGKNYLLFLRKSETDPYYLVAGVNYGKINLEESETDAPKELREANTEYSKALLLDYDNQEKIREKAKDKYAKEIQPYIQ